MNNVVIVGHFYSGEDLLHDVDDFLVRNREILFDIFLKIHALNVFHDQVLHPVFFTNVVHTDDVRVHQFSGSQSLTLKPFDCFGVITQIKPKQLDRNIPVQDQVVG